MVAIEHGRRSVDSDDEVVVFLIGARINRLRSASAWRPVLTAMPRMLRELDGHPELGLLHARSYWSGRTVLVVQYWRSVDHLMGYARASEAEHLPAWRAYNAAVRGADGAVGIFHETYRTTAGSREVIYGEMPPTGLGAALGTIALTGAGRTARRRMNATATDEVAVPLPSE